jgi:hypothetical protein
VTERTARDSDPLLPRHPGSLVSPRDRRSRTTFWIDDRVIDLYGPLLERFPFGADALAVYAVLARRADRDGESWERVKPMARLAATKERTFQRCIRLLELLGLVAVESCYFEGTNIQTSNRYTLLTTPQDPPEVDPDPACWPAPVRPVVFVSKGATRRHVADARPRPPSEAPHQWTPPTYLSPTGCRPDTTPGVVLTPTARPADTPPGVTATPQEGETPEGNTGKEESLNGKDGCKKTAARRRLQEDDKEDTLLAITPSFVIDEIGLSNRQVWAAALAELARRGDVGRPDLESWLRPAALTGRDGPTLIIGASNAVARDRIATRLLPAVRDALAATIGAPVDVSVIVI